MTKVNPQNVGGIILPSARSTSAKRSAEKSPRGQAALLDNVQFIYELSLAHLELRALGADVEVSQDLRSYELLNENPVLQDELIKKTAYFKEIGGQRTYYSRIIKKNRTRSVNQYLTHWIYPYKGKFHPQMVRALINIIGLKEGDTLLDPFIGSGTTAVEAQLLGVNCLGIDISPLCVLQSKVKTESPFAIEEIESYKDEFTQTPETPLFEKKRGGDGRAISSEVCRNFFKLAELVAISDNARRKRNYTNALAKNVQMMVSSTRDYADIINELSLTPGRVKIQVGDARELNVPSESVDGIITSPPYSIALDYVANDAHSLRALGYDLVKIKRGFVGVRGKGKQRLEYYNEDIKKAYDEMARVVKPKGFIVIVIGNATYGAEEIKTVEFTERHFLNAGYSLKYNVDKIIFGLYNVMRKENVLIFRKQQ